MSLSGEPIPANLQHVDAMALAELRDVMEAEFTILIETFLQDSRERIRHIREAWEAADAERFGRACHSFKGSCINIGLPRLAALCRQGEVQGMAGSLEGATELLEAIETEFARIQELLRQELSRSPV